MVALRCFRLILTPALLAGAMVAFAGPLDAHVSPDLRACTVQAALQELQKQGSVRLSVEPSLAGEVVVLRADARLGDVLDRLARVLDAKLVETPDGYRLRRSDETRRKLDAEAKAGDTARVVVAWDRVRRVAETLPATPYDRARLAVEDFRKMDEQTHNGEAAMIARRSGNVYNPTLRVPANLLLKQIVADLGAERLASLPRYRTVTFSSEPATRSERPLPDSCAKHLAEYAETENQLAQYVTDNPSFSTDSSFRDWWHASLNPGKSFEPGKTLVLFWRTAASLWCEVGTFARDGSLRAMVAETLSLPPAVTAAPDAGAAAWAPLGDGSKALENGSGDGKEAIVASISDGSFEPLSLAATDAVLGLANDEKLQLVARLPDDLCAWASKCISADQIDLRKFESAAPNTRFDREGGWLLVAPQLSAECEASRLPRASIRRFLTATRAAGEIAIRPYAVLAAESHGIWLDSAALRTVRKALDMAGYPKFDGFDVPASLVRFIGTLSEDRWRKLLDGESLDVGLLPPESKDVFLDWANTNLQKGTPVTGATVASRLRAATEAMPSGPIVGLPLALERKPDTVVLVQENEDPESPMFPPRPLPLATVADEIANMREQKYVTKTSDLRKRRFRLGAQPTLVFRAVLTPGIELTDTVRLRTPESAFATPVAFEDLPPNVRSLLWPESPN